MLLNTVNLLILLYPYNQMLKSWQSKILPDLVKYVNNKSLGFFVCESDTAPDSFFGIKISTESI